MMAGAPGASGSLVILSSSGEMDGKPSLARTATGQKLPAARITDKALHATNTTRRSSMFELPTDCADQRAPPDILVAQPYSGRPPASIAVFAAVFAAELSGSAARRYPPARTTSTFSEAGTKPRRAAS